MAGSSMTWSLYGRDVSASRALRGVSGAAESTGRTFGGKLRAGTIAAGVALGNLATQAIQMAAGGLGDIISTQSEFESTMNVFQVTTNSTASSMGAMSDLAIQMGQDTVYSANEAASAMLELAKAGLAPAEIQAGALSAAMSIAATEGLDLADAATIASKAMNAFQLSGKDANQIADALAGAANASSASVESLGDGLKYVGSTAHQYRLSLNDTVGALAALSSAGLDGTTAGTSLNRMLLAMSPTTEKAAKTFRQLGLNFFDANGRMKDMAGITKTLQAAFGDLGDAERSAAMKRAFGVEGMRAANILMQAGKQKVDDYVQATKKQGSAQDLANARMKGTAGAVEQMRGSLETLQLKIGQVLAPTIQLLAGAVATAASWLADNLQPALVAAGQWIQSNLVPAMQQLWAMVSQNLQPAIESLGQFWREQLLPALRDSWPAIQQVVVAAARMVGVMIVVASWIIGKVVPALVQFWSGLITLGHYIGNVIGKFGEWQRTVHNVIGRIIQAAEQVLQWFRDLPGNIQSAVSGFGSLLWNAGRDLINGLVDGIKSLASAPVDAVKNVGSNIVNGFKGLLGISSPSKVFRELGGYIGEGLALGIQDGKKKATDALKDMSTSLMESARRLRDQLHDSAISGGLQGITTGEGEPSARSQYSSYAAKLRTFVANLTKLRKAGLAASLIQQIAGMGVDQGGAIAADFLAGGAAAITRANADQASIEKSATRLGVSVSGIKAAQQVHQVSIKVEDASGDPQIGKRLVKALDQYYRTTGIKPRFAA